MSYRLHPQSVKNKNTKEIKYWDLFSLHLFSILKQRAGLRIWGEKLFSFQTDNQRKKLFVDFCLLSFHAHPRLVQICCEHPGNKGVHHQTQSSPPFQYMKYFTNLCHPCTDAMLIFIIHMLAAARSTVCKEMLINSSPAGSIDRNPGT